LEVDFIWFLGAKMFPEPQRCIAFTMMLYQILWVTFKETLSLFGPCLKIHHQGLLGGLPRKWLAFMWGHHGNWVTSSLSQEVQNVHFAAGVWVGLLRNGARILTTDFEDLEATGTRIWHCLFRKWGTV
jgi:hypothetical protein